MDQKSCENRLAVELIAVTPEPERVIEQAGRTCYLSFDRIDADSSESFIRRLIKMGHESPLEHAYATFRIRNCSRAMTHQLVRHRLMAISQQSQRYVNEDEFAYVVPESMPAEFVEDFHQDMAAIQAMYRKWRQRGLRKEDARFVLPNACTSEIVVSANFREWRHIFALRLSPKAQWEIRQVCQAILAILIEHAPACFDDITVKGSGARLAICGGDAWVENPPDRTTFRGSEGPGGSRRPAPPA